jgi:hypothetical protein
MLRHGWTFCFDYGGLDIGKPAQSERAAAEDVRQPQKAARCPHRRLAGGHERQHPRAATSVR